jgi:hypothetical protein
MQVSLIGWVSPADLAGFSVNEHADRNAGRGWVNVAVVSAD